MTEEERKKEIEELKKSIEEYKGKLSSISDKTIDYFTEFSKGFTGFNLDFNEKIISGMEKFNELKNEFVEINGEKKNKSELVKKINEGIDKYGQDLGTTREELKSLNDQVEVVLSSLKKNVCDTYDNYIDFLGKEVNKLKQSIVDNPDYSQELIDKINNLHLPKKINMKGYNSVKINIDGDRISKLKEFLDELNEVGRLREDYIKNETSFAKDDFLEFLEQKLLGVEQRLHFLSEMDENTTQKSLNEEIDNIEVSIEEVRNKLFIYKNKLNKEEMNKLANKTNELENLINKLRIDVSSAKRGKHSKEEKVSYTNLKEELLSLNSTWTNMINLMKSLKGEFLASKDYRDGLENIEKGYEEKLANIKSRIDKLLEDKVIDQKNYDNLIKYYYEPVEYKKTLYNQMMNDINNYQPSTNHYEFNGVNIDYVNNRLDDLEKLVNEHDKPIKRQDRKIIDELIKNIVMNIKMIENNMNHDSELKDNDEKRTELENKLNESKKRLDEISKKYRSKCPLLVRGVKEAKNFYKNHKKAVLIVAGLATIALLHATLGPVIIPAIMHGNLMIMSKIPAASRGALIGINQVLGSLIHASEKMVSIGASGQFKAWVLANGVIINPTCAASSLLKGVAIAGTGSTLLSAATIAPVIATIKMISEKGKKISLKEKLTNAKESLKNKKDEVSNSAKSYVTKKKEDLNKLKQELKDKTKPKDLTETEMDILASDLAKNYDEAEIDLPTYLAKDKYYKKLSIEQKNKVRDLFLQYLADMKKEGRTNGR